MLELIPVIILLMLPLAARVDNAHPNKCDTSLQLQLQRALTQNINVEIRIIGDCELPLNTRLCQTLCDSGVSFLTITGNQFIAKGKPRQILQLAKMNLILK